MIKKSYDSDPTILKSYRPISLLPVLGKILEKVICTRITEETLLRMSNNQYGFTKGRSTTDAIRNLINWHSLRTEKHKLVILLDISGAFDNLKWTALHGDLDVLGCSNYIKAITKSYLHKRYASLDFGGCFDSVILTKGCPQGSIFGPILWNISINRLLEENLPEHTHIQAYAENIAVSVAANTRTQLIQRATQVLETVKAWGDNRELNFSSAKSVAVVLNSNLTPRFTIPFGSDSIITRSTAKYLGVWIDLHLNFKHHIRMIKDKNIILFSRLRCVLGHDWGMKRSLTTLLYQTVFIPKVMYAAELWSNAADYSECRKTLLAIQRVATLAITSAYKTASTECLQVIAGTLPLDLEVKLHAAKATHRGHPNRDTIIKKKSNELLNIWQERWNQTSKASWTHVMIPDVRNSELG